MNVRVTGGAGFIGGHPHDPALKRATLAELLRGAAPAAADA